MITCHECLLCYMGWATDDVFAHFESGGYRVWEFLPVDGLVWLERVNPKTKKPVVIRGVYG